MDRQHGKLDPKTVGIKTAARLSYLLTTVKVIEFKRVSVSYMENLKTVCLHINCQ